MRSKTIFLTVLLISAIPTFLIAQTFDGDKPQVSYNSQYEQFFNPDSGWNNIRFYKQWNTLQPSIFRASDISSGYLQFVWIEKRVICSRQTYDPPYMLETDLDYSTGSNRGGVVIRVNALSESVQEPEDDPGFNREGIAFYPTSDGAYMNVQFSESDKGYESGMEIIQIPVPKPANVETLMGRGILRIEDFGTSIYVYYNGDPFIRIDLGGQTERLYTSGTVYNADMEVMGTFSGMEIEISGKVAVAQRDANLRLYSGTIYYNQNIEPVDSAEYRDLYADTWVATDALNRRMPSYSEVGPVKEDKRRVVGIFYITWHTEDCYSKFKSPYSADVSKILQADPGARLNGSHPLWTENSYHWGEPEAGYFLSQDEYVIRKDMTMLSVAGVDLIVLDVTNAVRYWNEWEMLFKTMQRMKAEGNDVPKFCFWAYNGPVITVVQELYEWFYKYPQYEDLWFYWDGKPLLLYNSNPNNDATGEVYENPNPNYDPAALTDTTHPHYGDPDYTEEFYQDYTQEVKDFFTLRNMWWGYYEWNGERYVGTEDNWSFGYDLGDSRVKSMHPDDLVSTHNGKKEQAAVTPAQHPSSLVGKSWRRETGEPELNEYDLPVEAYVPWLDKTVINPEGYGIYFQDRWDEAITSDPEFLYINDWNEWTAGKYSSSSFPFMRRNSSFYFVDQYNSEFNRGVQPMKGGYSDNYYMQMAQNIRRYKGVRQRPELKGSDTIQIDGLFSDWEKVTNVFQDARGDTYHRSHKGYGGLYYTNETGRNDIITSKVTYDDNYLSFYVETARDLTPASDSNWMLLFLDADRNHGTGWEGYDFIANLGNTQKDQTTLKQWDGKSWTNELIIPYAVNGNRLELQIPRSAVLLEEGIPEFYFKWADNPRDLENITSFFTDGDVAPDRRFNYNFSNTDIKVQDQTPFADLEIPGTLEFEDFDLGGAGIAYSDADIANNGGKYRPEESVDIEQAENGDYFLHYLNVDEWLEYTLDVNALGTYKMTVLYASGSADNKLVMSFDDLNQLDTIVLPASGEAGNWAQYDMDIQLSAGPKQMKISITSASEDFKLEKLVFSEVSVVYPGKGSGLEKTLWLGEIGGRSWFKDSICTEIDEEIDEKWSDVSPGCGVRNDFWNIRWTGFLEALFSEEYTFYLTANDLGRLWVKDSLIIDSWASASTGQTNSGKITLKAGEKIPIRVDFAEKMQDASVKLEWESMHNPKEIVPKSQLFPPDVTTSTGINGSPKIQIYPNPAKNQVTIESFNQNIYRITIYDIYGQQVLSVTDPYSYRKILNISHLENGLYLVKVKLEDQTIVLKLTK